MPRRRPTPNSRRSHQSSVSLRREHRLLHGAWVAAFTQRLSELGWRDGRNVKIEYRWAAGDIPQTTKFAAEFVQQKVDVIVTSASGVPAAKEATSTIPIISA